jgi:predicted TIM-barrel fold metal-dependent hydrolase
VIVDCHTHVFPPSLVEARERLLAQDTTFGELYGSARARLATADELLVSMDAAGIDVSVALGFAWTDAATCREHNDYLLEKAARSNGRIVAFCTLPLAAGMDAIVAEAERCAAAGARGFGELRPESLGLDLDDEALGTALAVAAGSERVLLFHVSEPVGHAYPGKRGLALDAFYRFVAMHPETNVIGAHWGGGLPFYALMPEVKLALARCSFDTAGSSLLYGADVYQRGVELIGSASIVFGSDFPLLSQGRSRQRIEGAGLAPDDVASVLGGNAARLFGLDA